MQIVTVWISQYFQILTKWPVWFFRQFRGEICLNPALLICLLILCAHHQHPRHHWFVFLFSTKLEEKDLPATFQHSELHWLAHWGTTITAQNKVPYLLLIGPNRVFIICGRWHAYCCLVETCLEKQSCKVAVLFVSLNAFSGALHKKKF